MNILRRLFSRKHGRRTMAIKVELLQRQYNAKGIAGEVGDLQDLDPLAAYKLVAAGIAKALDKDGVVLALEDLAELAGVEIEDPADEDPADPADA